MEQHQHSSLQQGNDEQLSKNTGNVQQQDNDTIEGCTMDPCPMKEKNKSVHVAKCPDCGKTEKVEAALK